MVKGSDYGIKKIEKGPLQRFKNQNLLIKKFGEVGLQIYKAITGKRTTKELRKDLDIEKDMFDEVISYMSDAGMIELEPVGRAAPEPKMAEEAPEEIEEPIPEEEVVEEELIEPEGPPALEELPEEEEEEEPPLEEKPQEEITFEEIAPIEFDEEEAGVKKEELEEEPEPEEELELEKEPEPEEELELEKEPEEAPVEEIEPIGAAEEPVEEETEEPPPEEPEEKPPEEELEPEEETIGFEETEEVEEKTELSPVEKIISDKYGDLGLRVYALIDGQRTAEEIMKDTGLTEAKLVEILDFMDEQGIIKLDYPKGGGKTAPPVGPTAATARAPPPQAKGEMGFVPMIEGEESLEEARGIASPLETPVKSPLDIVKSVQLKAKIMLKLGDKGSRVLEHIDGKNDIIDIALKLDMPLYEVSRILNFMFENGMVMMKRMGRSDVHRKYGDDGYSVYKKYGKEGLMLYELIGKELTIKQMADKITKERAQIIDMFIFIHKVLGIELPIDRDVLARQLEI